MKFVPALAIAAALAALSASTFTEAAPSPQTNAAGNIIWSIPVNTTAVGTSASIAATFLSTVAGALFDILIVSGSTVYDVVASGQSASAIGVWHIPAMFPTGTYDVQIVVTNAGGAKEVYTAPIKITVTRPSSASSTCPTTPFRAQTASSFSPIAVFAPSAGQIVDLPAASANTPGDITVAYEWKVESAAAGYRGATAVYVDVLAVGDASKPGESQTPSATVAHTSINIPTASATSLALSIPTVAAIQQFFGPAVVRVNYSIAGTTGFKSVFSDTFYLERSCDGQLAGPGAGNNTGRNGTGNGTNPTVKVQVDESPFIKILVGAIVGAVALTAAVCVLIFCCIRRRRQRRQDGAAYQGFQSRKRKQEQHGAADGGYVKGGNAGGGDY